MKKLILLTVFCLFAPFGLKAQVISYGLHTGIAYTTVAAPESERYGDVSTSGSSFAYHIGLFLRGDLKNFYLEGDIVFTGNAGGVVDGSDVKASYLGAPLMLGKKFYPGFRIFAGLVPNLILGVKGDEFGDDDLFSMNMIGGAGVDISKLTLSLRYERCILWSQIYYEKSGADVDAGIITPMLSLCAAIRFN